MKSSTRLLFIFCVVFVMISCLTVFLVNYQMREQALLEARAKARILLDRNFATHTYFSQHMKPKIFSWSEGFRSKDYFDPSWMSSTYAVREIDKYFKSMTDADYYYKECAINARIPQNEADEFERGFLRAINSDPTLIERADIRYFERKPFLTVMRKAEVMEESCLRCHGDPSDAPGDLVKYYGNERSFNRELGDVVSAVSIRIPLHVAYANANHFSLQLSLMVLGCLSALFFAFLWSNSRFFVKPLEILREKALQIAGNTERLGEEIPLPGGRELNDLTSAFNSMSVALRQNRDELEDRVRQRTFELEQSEERYRMLFDKMLDAFALHQVIEDEEGKMSDYRFITVNPSFEEITGLAAVDTIGKTALEVLPGLDSSWIKTFEMVVASGEPIRFERYSAEIGKHFEVLAFRVREGQFACIFKDITRRKEAEEELKKFFHLSNDMLCIATEDGFLKQLNPTWEKLLGYSEEELMSRPFIEFVHPDDTARTYRAFASLKEGKSISNLVNRYRCRNGAYRWFSWGSTPDLGSGLFYAVARDITEIKMAEEKSERMEAQLRQAQKLEAIGTLAGGIAHDFNNILAAIIGFADMAIISLPATSPLYYDLEQILKAGHRAKDLVRQILTFSRYRSDEDLHPSDLSPVIKEAVKLLRASIPTTIEIRHAIAPEPLVVMADPTQIHQVLLNLCTNGAQAMEESGGILEIRLSGAHMDADSTALMGDIEPGAYVELAVSDTGHGMDLGTKERIFDPYFTTKEVGKGSGLGLAVVHGIVRGHKGAISVQSEPGKGSAFHVYLPRLHGTFQSDADESVPLPTGTERVLLVDDEEILVEMGRRMLEMLGYHVLAKTRGFEALETFRANPDDFDIVVTDYTMPHMTGIDLAKEIMTIRPDIPVILCTGFSQRISEDTVKAMGITEYIMKPLSLQNLAHVMRKAFNRNERG